MQQIVEAFRWNTAPTYLVRDNDGAYGHAFTSRVCAMGIRNRPIAPRSPWQNPYAERLTNAPARLFGSHPDLRRTPFAPDVDIIFAVYNETRTHLGLSKDAPLGRANDRGPSSLCQFYLDCIIATRGYDFREGQWYSGFRSTRATQMKRFSRRIFVAKGLHFEYEVSPDKTAEPSAVATAADNKVGVFVPFKQSRLKGQINPLRPPHQVETVLIGRALGQPTGYLHGVGFRVKHDGYIEAEFASGVRTFRSYKEFKSEIARLLAISFPTSDAD